MKTLILTGWPTPRDTIAAQVLDLEGTVVGVVPEPHSVVDTGMLRDAIVAAVLNEDFGDIILAGVAFAAHLGGDAVGFT